MILDTLMNTSRYEAMHPGFKGAFAFMKEAVKTLPEEGRYDIDGDKVYALVQRYETVPVEETKWEAHKKFIDIQFIIKGTEIIGWDTIENLPEGTVFNEEKDCYVFRGENATDLKLEDGTFAIFWPEDLHKPKEQFEKSSDVYKIVVKIAV